MIALSNIKQLDYEMPPNVMVVHLKEYIIHNGYRTKEVRYKITYEQFLARAVEWRRYHNKDL